MVKTSLLIHKPTPKSIKKDATTKPKKSIAKKTKVDSTKEKVKKIAITPKPVKDKAVKQKQNTLGLNVNSKKVDSSKEKVKKIVSIVKPVKKNQVVKQIQEKSFGPNVSKEAQEKVKKINVKKKPMVVQVQNTVEEITLKKKPIAARVKKTTTEKKKPSHAKIEKKIALVSKAAKKNSVKTIVKSKILKSGSDKKQNFKTKNAEEQTTKVKSPIYEPVGFDEKKFKDIVCSENIKKISTALKDLVEKQVSQKKTSIFADYRYFLNVSSFKIPNCPKRMVKLNLKHSLVDTDKDDVVMIVPDLQRGIKVDYEPTKQHYEDLLREIGVANIKIMPFNQLRNECSSFEAKRKFSNTYDYFLCDGRIVQHVVGFCGSYFQKPRTTIHAVRLDNPKTYKSAIEHALKRTSYRQLKKGDMISIPVGNHLFTINKLVDNIEHIIAQLKINLPGSYANIRQIHIKIDIKGTSSMPLYINLAAVPKDVPNVIGPREQRMVKLKKEANIILSKFNLSKTGEFVKLSKSQVKRKRQFNETQKALLSEKNDENYNDNDEVNEPLKKKVKKEQIAASNKSQDEDGSDDTNQVNSDMSDEE